MPTKATTVDTVLLKDSVYVQHFRAIAYKKTVARRTTGHYLLLAGIIAAGVTIIVGTIIVITHFEIPLGTGNYSQGIQ